MRLGGTIILFYPGNEVIQNILSYINILEKLYVIDNSEYKNVDLVNQIAAIDKVIYLHTGENRGLAERLNQATELAIDEGFDLLLTMDQDSYFEKGIAEEYVVCINKYESHSKTAMYGVEYLQRTSDNQCSPIEISELITSGSIINLQLFPAIGRFDDALFIDLVDHEYCYRAIITGYKVVKFANIFLCHRVGESFKGRSIKTFIVTERSLHSPLRLYYMIRNYLYVKKKYNTAFTREIKNQRNSILTRIKNGLIYSNNRMKLIRYIFRAIDDYRRKRMGKIIS